MLRVQFVKYVSEKSCALIFVLKAHFKKSTSIFKYFFKRTFQAHFSSALFKRTFQAHFSSTLFKYAFQIHFSNTLFKYTLQAHLSSTLFKYTFQVLFKYFSNTLFTYTFQITFQVHFLFKCTFFSSTLFK